MTTIQSDTRTSWNQSRIVGPKPPLKPKHIWVIRTRLQHDSRVRDLVMVRRRDRQQATRL